MSDIGVHSNLYQRVMDYADLVDEVLVAMKCGSSNAGDSARQQLADLLIGLGASHPSDLDSAWLSMLLGGANAETMRSWERVGRALRSTEVTDGMVTEIETLAVKLEQRRTDALAKMRGSRT